MATAEDLRYDVAVAGNGVLGLSLGLVLARSGHRVAVVGPPHRRSGGSKAAGAMLGCFGEVTSSLTKSEHGRKKLELGIEAAKRWPAWLVALEEQTGRAGVRTATGTTVILNTVGTPEIDDANYRAIKIELARYEEPNHDVDPADVEWIDAEPISRPLAAFHVPGEHGVNAAELLVQLEEALTAAGGHLVPEVVTAVVDSAGRATGLSLENGDSISAGTVVLAAGAYTQDLLAPIQDESAMPPIVSGYGVSALVTTEDGTGPDSVIRTPNRSFACGLHVVPRTQGEVYIGATNVVSTRPLDTPVMRDLVFLLQCAHRQVRRGLWSSDLTKVQVGNRPVAVDGFPLVGAAGMEGLWVMTGTYRDGLHMSPLLADEMARMITGDEPTVDLTPFRPLRRPIQGWSRDDIVEDVVLHAIATGFEQDWRVPVDWPFWIENDLRPAIGVWANELDPDFTPPPELLFGARFFPDLADMLRAYYKSVRAS
ncbi:MAG: NAD(P)/FAD-dependent oxidoreductase [Pseudonocardia sp.]